MTVVLPDGGFSRQPGLDALDNGREVHVWHGQVGDRLPSADAELLSPDERARSEQMMLRPEVAARFAGAHAAVRRVLAIYLGIASRSAAGQAPMPLCRSPQRPGSWTLSASAIWTSTTWLQYP